MGANGELNIVADLSMIAASHGYHFSVENPANSHLSEVDEISDLAKQTQCIKVYFAQYCYGLKFADSKLGEFCKKPTCIITKMPRLRYLAHTCPGTCAHQQHVHAWGSMKAGQVPAGTLLRRAAAAGAYTPQNSALRGPR